MVRMPLGGLWCERATAMQVYPASLDGAFVGRERELGRLRARLEGALAGQGGVVLLAGEAGIGKTRLTEELAGEARFRGASVLWGRCHEGEGAPAFWPWIQILRVYVQTADPETLREDFGRGAGVIARLVPELQETASGGADPPAVEPLDAAAGRFRLFDSITTGLTRGARRQPLLLILDDLHWADTPSLLLLQFLARQLREARLLVICAYRDAVGRSDPLTVTLAELSRERSCDRLALSGLSDAEAGRLIEANAGLVPDRVFVAAIMEQTDGNPFFVQEVSRHLRESGQIGGRDDDSGLGTSQTARLAAFAIPDGVRQVIRARLSRLAADTNRVLSQAAVLGREFEFELLRTMAGLTEDALVAALEEAVAAQLLVAVRGRGAATYTFRHALIRQTLDEELNPPLRQRLHLRAAEAMEAIYARTIATGLTASPASASASPAASPASLQGNEAGASGDPSPPSVLLPSPRLGRGAGGEGKAAGGLGPAAPIAALATHYRLAGTAADAEKGIAYSLLAGEQAQAVFAWEEAVSHWQAAVEMMEAAGADPKRRADLLVRLGDLIFATQWGAQRGRDVLDAARAIYADLGLVRQAAEAQARLGRFFVTNPVTGDLPRALAHFRAARPVLEDAAEPDGAALAYVYIGFAHASMRNFSSTAELPALLERAVAIGERLGDVDVEGQALALLPFVPAVAGWFGEALALLDRAWALAAGRCTLMTSLLITFHQAIVRVWLWDPRAAADWQQQWLRQPATEHATGQRSWYLLQLARQHWRLGEVDTAQQLTADAGGGVGYLQRLYLLGDWTQAGAEAAQRAELFRRAGDYYNEGGCWDECAAAARLAGDPAAAEAAWRAALAPLPAESYELLELHYRPSLALLLAETGRPAEARSEVERCRATVTNGEDWRGLLGSVERAEAATLASEGDLPRAELVFERALAIFAQYGLVWEEAEAHLVWGRFLARGAARERTVAHAHLAAAVAIYRRIGAAERWIERAREQVTGNREPVARTRRSSLPSLSPQSSVLNPHKVVRPRRPAGLTPREVEVLGLLAEGLSNREIAEALVLSVRTVERHIADVYQLIGVGGRSARAAATAYALTRGPAPAGPGGAASTAR